MELQRKKATRTARKAKIVIAGPSGSGKTFTALLIAEGFRRWLKENKGVGCEVVVMDTEHGSAGLYENLLPAGFDVIDMPNGSVETFRQAFALCKDAEVIVPDSLTHFWANILDEKDKYDKRGGNSFTNWGEFTPQVNKFIKFLTSCQQHVIGTLRVKTDYVLEPNAKGKQIPKKIGLAPVFREGLEYEFDIFGRMDLDHNLFIEKTRIPFLTDQIISKPTEQLGYDILDWLMGDGATDPEPEPDPELKREHTQDQGYTTPVAPPAEPAKPKKEDAPLPKKFGDYEGKVLSEMDFDELKAFKKQYLEELKKPHQNLIDKLMAKCAPDEVIEQVTLTKTPLKGHQLNQIGAETIDSYLKSNDKKLGAWEKGCCTRYLSKAIEEDCNAHDEQIEAGEKE